MRRNSLEQSKYTQL
jgi:hypothetical protein